MSPNFAQPENPLWRYNDPSNIEPIDICEQQILLQYFPWWSGEMMRMGRQDLISEDNCIQDWVTVNWAWRVEPT